MGQNMGKRKYRICPGKEQPGKWMGNCVPGCSWP